MSKGTIKKIIPDKKYGFISPDEETSDLFFHYKNIKGNDVQKKLTIFDSLNQDDEVEFEIKEGPKGKYAENIVVAGAEVLDDEDVQADAEEEDFAAAA